MAQTTGATSARNAVTEFSTDGTNWTNCSGFSNKVEWDGGTRQTGSAPTFDGDTMVQTAGKRELITVKFTALYTEGASDIATAARTAWRNGTAFYLRWTVKAATTGNTRYTTSAGYVRAPVLPAPDTTNGDPVPLVVELETPDVTDAAIP